MSCLHLFTTTTQQPLGNGRTLYITTCNGCGVELIRYEG